mmetsp:Transcript_19357/g.24975  ORF Transcript_19357/g.24975 Transcript_19357/m.24975 type:complete len:88 (-) Transcript_19357:333-596(-)|eukprot:CAMPEP_0198140990 /NCGR_PEP_ID=MMETSP1443-20131203/4059_1 /TAXON_ID=186043 /ORGANISM="Entomoneis sp., Strain CCMP2396" /LENGTH=87 /DNA_ID=CAMNT_0043803585 /DNA_START=156 /DNA_END=419 /DNA_ORIENTATION=+
MLPVGIMPQSIDLPKGIDDDMSNGFIISSKVDDYDGERRFVWKHETTLRLGGGESLPNSAFAGGGKPSHSNIGKHQKNFSATKYIKP